MNKTVLLLLLGLGLVASAAETTHVRMLAPKARPLAQALEAFQREAVSQQGTEYALPQLIIGGEWTATIKLTNKGTTQIPWSNVYFIDNYGNPLSSTFQTSAGNVVTDTGFSFTLSSNGVLEVTFSGGSTTRFGWALIDPDACPLAADCTLYGEVVLRNRNSSRPDFESIFPLESPSDVQYMLWDHRSGYSTVLYLVSMNTSDVTVSLEFRGDNDALIRAVDLTMGSAEARILIPHELAPETIGRQGTLVIRAKSAKGELPLIVATALRINPTNSFTPLRTFTQKRPLQ